MGNLPAILKITDGTPQNTIDCLARGLGYHLKSWGQSVPDISVEMGTNWFTGDQRPVSKTVSMFVEPMTFAANASSANGLVSLEGRFRNLLVMATNYWINGSGVTRPFYLIVKNDDETYPRYATILAAKLHGSGNPFAQPFFNQKPADDDLAIAITHSGWRDFPPGQAKIVTDVAKSKMDSFLEPLTYGVAEDYPALNNEIVVANYFSNSNITHIFRGGNAVNWRNYSFTDNDDELLIYTPTDGYVYFGARIQLGDNHEQFTNLVFNLSSAAQTGGDDFVWEISAAFDGWIPLDSDNIWGNIALDPSVDPPMITWVQQPSWAPHTINGIYGYWIRMSAGTEDVYQVGYHVHSASWPYIDIVNDNQDDAGIDLDLAVIPAIDPPPSPETEQPPMNRIIVSALPLNDDTQKFIPYISPGLHNVVDSGITWYQTYQVIEDEFTHYGLKGIKRDVSNDTSPYPVPPIFTGFKIDYSVAPAYVGRHRAFLRLAPGKSGIEEGMVYFWLEIRDVGGSESTVKKITRKVTDGMSPNYVTVLDLGPITLGSDRRSGFGLTNGAVEQNIFIRYDYDGDISIAEWINFYDLVLMPQDTWYADISISGALQDLDDELVLSSAITPMPFNSIVRDRVSQTIVQTPSVSPGLPLRFETSGDYRFFFMMLDDWYVTNSPDYLEASEQTVGVTRARLRTSFNHFLRNGQIAKANRYFGGRGNRGG